MAHKTLQPPQEWSGELTPNISRAYIGGSTYQKNQHPGGAMDEQSEKKDQSQR